VRKVSDGQFADEGGQVAVGGVAAGSRNTKRAVLTGRTAPANISEYRA